MMILMSITLIILSVIFAPVLCKNTDPITLDSSSAELQTQEYVEDIIPRFDKEYEQQDYLYDDLHNDSDSEDDVTLVKSNADKKRHKKLIQQYGYSLKILANTFLVGFGVYVKSGWVMTSYCLLDTQISKLHKVSVETYDSHRFLNKGGQSRAAASIKVHPKYEEEACNYDVILLKLATSFDSIDISIASIATGPKPTPHTTCVVPTPFDRKMIMTKVTIRNIVDCKFHEDYETVVECAEKESLFCIQMKERLYGAPIICNEMLVGVLPTNMDITNNLTIVQHIDSYKDWLDEIIVVRARLKSSKGTLLKSPTVIISLTTIVILSI